MTTAKINASQEFTPHLSEISNFEEIDFLRRFHIVPTQDDSALTQGLQSFTRSDREFWSFRSYKSRNNHHAYYQYPAMMVPEMQGHLIDAAKRVRPLIRTVYDPFMGSGTILGESMLRGLNFIGNDINPLAVLICKVKSDSFRLGELEAAGIRVIDRAVRDNTKEIDIYFLGLIKWFRSDVATKLCTLRRSILLEKYKWVRRFLWVCLAETVRWVSNSKQTTYKLHSRSAEEIWNREIDVISIFSQVFTDNLTRRSEFKKSLDLFGRVKNGRYIGDITLCHADSVNSSAFEDNSGDILISSPPYGDNRTTVSYGQQSYLPLQWIDLNDIEPDMDEKWRSTPYYVDKVSVGGIASRSEDRLAELVRKSPAIDIFISSIDPSERSRISSIVSFFYDMDLVAARITKVMKPDSYMIWTVGNRRVNHKLQPMDLIFTDLLISHGAEFIHNLSRHIPSKRFYRQIGKIETMNKEHVIVCRTHTGDQ